MQMEAPAANLNTVRRLGMDGEGEVIMYALAELVYHLLDRWE